jgi:hypothetical protein
MKIVNIAGINKLLIHPQTKMAITRFLDAIVFT